LNTRGLFSLDPAAVFLNHGSFGATPVPVMEVRRAWEARMERQPVAFFWDEYPARVRESARVIAEFVHADPAHLVFIENATTGVDAVLRGRRWRPGDRVLSLSHGYQAVRQAIRFLADYEGIVPVEVPIPFPMDDEDQILTPLMETLKTGISLAVLDHITSPTGLVLPIAAMIRLCREAGVPVLVDGAHAPGQIPLDLPALGADWYTGNLHKWAFAPKGTAFLWVSPQQIHDTPPLAVSHGYRGSLAEAFEWSGTRDPAAWLAAPAGLAFWESQGGPSLMAQNRALQEAATRLWEGAFSVRAPAPTRFRAALSALPLPGGPPPTEAATRAFSRRLWAEHRVEVPVLPFAGKTWVRISAQLYNDEGDYQTLIDAVRAAGAA
jgi:isopenicillin-N epimerase